MATPIDALRKSAESYSPEDTVENIRPGSGYLLREVEKHATSTLGPLLNRLRRHELPEQIYMQRAATVKAPTNGKGKAKK